MWRLPLPLPLRPLTPGFLAMWRAYTTKEKAILLELIHLALFQAQP